LDNLLWFGKSVNMGMHNHLIATIRPENATYKWKALFEISS
jgi:hypothetical protein